ncbi:DUF2884 family protein [Xanthomonas sp. GPE 39]|uniref:DUF2884 family protein n=1 Tax=Xanthomonas sp. GPE 39 TaxID=1583099 RepID=UPI0005F2EEC3|nr:DUF2884 family protein [Xanthomonas sp. GPE 39]
MQHSSSLPMSAIALACLLTLSACHPSTPADNTDADRNDVQSTMTSDGDIMLNAPGQPPAIIGHDGSLSIDGKHVALNPEQSSLLMAYRGQIQALGKQGMEVGKQGAALGVKAAGEAVSNVFSGNASHTGDSINAQAEQVKQAAMQICGQIGALKTVQNLLAEKLPQFRPYAHLQQSDIQRCKDANK